jgi:hypothetical protein
MPVRVLPSRTGRRAWNAATPAGIQMIGRKP